MNKSRSVSQTVSMPIDKIDMVKRIAKERNVKFSVIVNEALDMWLSKRIGPSTEMESIPDSKPDSKPHNVVGNGDWKSFINKIDNMTEDHFK